MRFAILSALSDTFGHPGASAGERPAFRRFAGKMVLHHQIDCAAHLKCDRILCLAGPSGPDLGTARAYGERAGIRFETVDSLARMSAQVTADDEVIVLADGLLPDRNTLVETLSGRGAVLAFPADAALSLGFERIDAERAWSGALRMRGAGVAKLADMAPDSDVASSLLRIALQSGVPVVEIGSQLLSDAGWQRRVHRRASVEAERRWIGRQVQPVSFVAPGKALAERIALRLAQDASGERWARTPHLVAVLACLLSVALGIADRPGVGLIALLVGSLALAMAEMFDQVATIGAPPRRADMTAPAARLLMDVVLIGLLALMIATVPNWLRWAQPATLIFVLHLGAATAPDRLRQMYADRPAAIAILLLAATQGWVAPALAGMMLCALSAMLWVARSPRFQITPS